MRCVPASATPLHRRATSCCVPSTRWMRSTASWACRPCRAGPSSPAPLRAPVSPSTARWVALARSWTALRTGPRRWRWRLSQARRESWPEGYTVDGLTWRKGWRRAPRAWRAEPSAVPLPSSTAWARALIAWARRRTWREALSAERRAWPWACTAVHSVSWAASPVAARSLSGAWWVGACTLRLASPRETWSGWCAARAWQPRAWRAALPRPSVVCSRAQAPPQSV
mmetsp:Transcript_5218/g.14311  ORF Transcript_5218/g.14311 Transcript_5218/m.14311 type:complete len:226 (-) Transcript_5218:2238-2915(-)